MTTDMSFINRFMFRARTSILGLTFAVATIVFGQLMGIVFGLNEDAIKDQLKASAAEVRQSIYHEDDAVIKGVLDKSWTYMKRAHLHAGSMGTTAVVLIILNCLFGRSRPLAATISLGLGIGAFGYSIFWMWAGFRAPGLGGTTAAKESLKWLAMPSSGAFVVASTAVLITLIVFSVRLIRSR